VLGRTRPRTVRLAALTAVLSLTAASVAFAAPGTADSSQTARPGAAGQQLGSRIQQALLGLYALDSQLHAWRTRVASLQAKAAAIRQQQAVLREQFDSAQASLQIGRRRLGLNLRTIYEQGNVEPVAVLLGATSLSNGIRRLDDLEHVTDQARQIVAATGAASQRLITSRLRLAADGRRLADSLAGAQAAERKVEGAAAAKAAYVSSLRSQEQLRAAQVKTVVTTARAVQQKSQQLQAGTSLPPSAGGRQLTVSATCYDLPGKTATGMPVGPGVVAVDPSVIPLGSRMFIPGYGNGIAADVGSGIRGAAIDLWYPTFAQCAAWGRRTVTITVY
jgi:3D (Asp-Asp-Asp) domain-containing protein